MSKKDVSMKTIASELGVSINTVSHALRDKDDISIELKSKIRQKAIELGYMPNRVSRSMKKEERSAVAIVINSFNNLYFNTLCNYLMEIFNERDEFDFLLLFTPAAITGRDIVKRCLLQRVDFLITHLPMDKDAWELAQLNNLQVVMVGSASAYSSDCIVVDEAQGCALAARYLSLFHPASKFLYVGIDYPVSDYRFNLYKQEIESVNGEGVVQFNIDKENIERLYNYIRNGYRRIFCYNDAVAYDALYKLDRLAVDIRKLYPDLHIVGFDGLCEIICGLKPITTVQINFPELARETYDLIKQRIDDPSAPPQRKVVPVTLHQRSPKE